MNQNMYYMPTLKLDKLTAEERNKKVAELYPKFEQELKENYYELRDAFGVLDEATQKAFREWMVMEELLTRLNLNDETI